MKRTKREGRKIALQKHPSPRRVLLPMVSKVANPVVQDERHILIATLLVNLVLTAFCIMYMTDTTRETNLTTNLESVLTFQNGSRD